VENGGGNGRFGGLGDGCGDCATCKEGNIIHFSKAFPEIAYLLISNYNSNKNSHLFGLFLDKIRLKNFIV
jgi:hypothetical protein